MPIIINPGDDPGDDPSNNNTEETGTGSINNNVWGGSRTSSNRRRLEKYLQDVWTMMKNTHQDRQQKIALWRRQAYADSYRREPAFEGGSSIQIPLTRWILETIHDRLFLSQFGLDSPLVRVKPIDLNDTPIANALERVLRFYQKQSKKAHAVSLAMLDAILLGCGVVRIYYNKRKKKWGKERIHGHPKTEWVPLESFFLLNPYAPLEEQGAIAHVYYKRKGELIEELRSLGVEEPERVLELGAVSLLPVFGKTFANNDNETVYYNEKENEIVELADIYFRDANNNWWVSLFAPADGVSLYEREYRLTDVPPFFCLRFHPYGYGYGLAAFLEPFEEEMSVLHNQRIDNNTLINLPVFKVLTSSPALKDKEIWFAGKKIPVDTVDDITPLTIAERVTPLQDEMQIFEYVKIFTGISEILSGYPLRGEKTAYEVEAMLAEGSVKFRRYTTYVVEWIREQAQYELLLLKRYGDPYEMMYIVRPDFNANPFDFITEEDILYRFEIQGNTVLTNKELERQKWFLIRNILSQEQSVVSNPSAWYEVLRQLLTAYDVDYRTIIGEKPTPEDIAQQQQKAQMEALSAVLSNSGMATPSPELLQALLGGGGIPSVETEPFTS